MEASNNSSSCQVTFSEGELMILGITQACAAILSSIACALVLLIIVIFRKYECRSQRVILYLILAVFVLNIGYSVRGFRYDGIHKGSYCTLIAFLTQYGGGCILLAVFCLVIEILLNSGLVNSSYKSLDRVYILVIILGPLSVDWIPFIKNAYGPTKTWCWIRSTDPDTCETFLFGLILQYALWFGPVFITIFLGTILYVISYYSIKKQTRADTSVRNSRHVEQDFLIDIKQYRWYPLLFLIFNLIPFIARLAADLSANSKVVFIVWIIAGVIQGLQGSVIAMIFTLDPGTRKRLGLKSIKSAIEQNVLNHDKIEDYPAIAVDSDSKYTNYVEALSDTEQLSTEKTIRAPLIV